MQDAAPIPPCPRCHATPVVRTGRLPPGDSETAAAVRPDGAAGGVGAGGGETAGEGVTASMKAVESPAVLAPRRPTVWVPAARVNAGVV